MSNANWYLLILQYPDKRTNLFLRAYSWSDAHSRFSSTFKHDLILHSFRIEALENVHRSKSGCDIGDSRVWGSYWDGIRWETVEMPDGATFGP